MRKMGMAQEDIDASEVIIKCPDKEIIITEPSVAKIKAMGTEQFTVSGNVHERPISSEPEIREDDIQTVMEQANVSEQAAKEKLQETKGDIAKAILELKD